MIPAASFVTVTLAGQITGVQFAADVERAIAAELAGAGFVVRQVAITAPNAAYALLSGTWTHYDYTATIVVQTAALFASVDAVRALVLQIVADQTGSIPTGSAATLGGADVQPGAAAAGDPLGVNRAIDAIARELHTDIRIVLVGLLVVAAIGVVVYVE